jgi:hypothetical protein
MFEPKVPHRSFFDFAFVCPHRAQPPTIDGNLRDWSPEEVLPDLMGVEDRDPFARLLASWDDSGLYFGFEISRKKTYKIKPKEPVKGDCLELWIDTRDLKDSHRANRYCHRFYLLPGGRGSDGKQPIARHTHIVGAREQSPPCPEDQIEVGLRRLKRTCQMEIKIPAAGLNGFQPREFRRIGFNYILHDAEKGQQSWTCDGDEERSNDPSTWGTLELHREP